MSAQVREATQAYQASATSISVTVPTHVSGDQLVVFVMGDNSGASLTPSESGWTQLFNAPGAPGQTLQGAWHRTAGGSEPSTYTFTSPAVAGNMAAVMVSVNPDGDTLNAVTNSTLSATAGTATGTTTSVSGAANPTVVLGMWVSDDNNTVLTPPASMTALEFVDGSASELATYFEYNVGVSAFQRTLVWNTSTDVAQAVVILAYTAGGPNAGVKRNYRNTILQMPF